MYCVRCASVIPENSRFCPACGADQQYSQVKIEDNNIFIPNNNMALVSYYLAVASLLCGAVLGIPAVITGIMGLVYAKRNPKAKGKIHAWVGIILGGFATLFSIAFALFFILR